MKKNASLTVMGFLLAGAPNAPSWAIESENEAIQVTTLPAVLVTAVAPRSPLVFETDPRLPRQPVPASDGADYLKTIPGFNAIRNGGTNGDPVLRGMFGSRLNLLSGGGAMPGACPGRMDNPLSYVSPETYDRLVVVKGPQTVLWGPGASAGTVRFERETPRFESPGVRAAGSLLGGSFGRNDQVLNVTAGMPVGYVRFDGNRSQADDYHDGDDVRVPSRWKKWNADGAIGWTPDENTVLELAVGRGDGEARYAGRSMDGAQFLRESYGLNFEKKHIGGALDEIQASAYRNYADHVMDNYSLREPNPTSAMPMPMASNVDRLTTGGRIATTWKLGDVDVVAGVDTQESRHRRRSAKGRGAYKSQPWSTDARFTNAGAFTEITWHTATQGRIVGGLRADRATVRDERKTTGSMMPMPNPSAGVRRKETLPAGFLRFEQDMQAFPATWYAGIGHVARMPDYWELFSADRGPVGSVNPFTAIQPERTTQLDLGIQYRGEHFDAWASVYAGRMQDYILFRYTGGGMMGTTSQVSNVDADIRGGEAGIEWRPTTQWKMGGTLAYAWGENRTDGSALPQMPPLDARLTLGWDNGRWSLGGLFRAVARQNRVSAGDGNVTGRDLGPSAGFAVFSLNGSYRYNEKAWLSAGIDNVFDRLYSEHLNLAGNADFGYPGEPVRIAETGRNIWVKLNFRY